MTSIVRKICVPAVIMLVAVIGAGAQSRAVPADTRIELRRTECYGPCPAYTVSIDASGIVTWNGERSVRVRGPQTDRIPLSSVAALLDTADRIGFFGLEDRYRAL